MNDKEKMITVLGVEMPRRIFYDLLNVAANGFYDRKKEVSKEMAAVDLASDSRKQAIADAVFNFDNAVQSLTYCYALTTAFLATPAEAP